MCVCMYIFGSISSLIQISFNIIDIFCLHMFFFIRSYSRIAFISIQILDHQNNKQKLQIPTTYKKHATDT